jgi:type IX secretion system substrate protein
MNKLLTIILAIAITTTAYSVDKYDNVSINQNEKIDYTSPKLEVETISNKKNNSTQDLNDANVIRLFERFYFMHYSRSNPIAFDPSTNAIGIAINERQFLQSGAFDGSKLYMYRTLNYGDTWDSIHVYRHPDIGPFYPSLAFINIEKSSKIEDLSYIMYAPQTTEKINGVWGSGQGGTFSIYDKSIGTEPEPINQDAPESGFPPDDQVWGNLELKTNEVTNTIYGYGRLSPLTSNDQFGYYGYWGFDFDDQGIVSNIPKEWWANKFRDPNDKERTFNGPISVTNDDQGTLFASVNNRHFANSEPFLLGISKSTDGGDNWTDFEVIPELTRNSILDYHPGYTTAQFFNTFAGGAMFSTGTNKVSTIAEVIISGEGLPNLAFITEIKYDNGVFSLTEIVELETSGPYTTQQHSSTIADTNSWAIRYEPSRFGNNLQVARTVDGDKLVLMYIDGVKESQYALDRPVNIFLDVRDPLTNEFIEQPGILDSILQYDIFSVVYDMNTGTWGEAVNITNDKDVEVLFNIPNIIPDVKNVPILTYETATTSYRLNKFNFPKEVRDMLIDFFTFVNFTPKLDVTKTQDPIGSVDKQLDFNVEFGNVSPNPAVNTDMVEVSFSVEKLSTVSLAMYDNMGNRVSTLLNNRLTQANNNNTLNANISNLNSGTYYLQLTVNGVSFTKKMVIVK